MTAWKRKKKNFGRIRRIISKKKRRMIIEGVTYEMRWLAMKK